MEASRRELLKKLADGYLSNGISFGFTLQELEGVVNEQVAFRMHQDAKETSDEECYYRLFEQKLREMQNERFTLPKPDILNKGLEIMYIVHICDYNDYNLFIDVVSQKFGMSKHAARGATIGTNPCAGLLYIIRNAMDYSEWLSMKIQMRMKSLRYIEKNFYNMFREEFENKRGQG